MLVTPFGMIMFVKANAFPNTSSPMLLRDESGSNVTVVKLVAPLNALVPMAVTLAGILIDVKADALRNVWSPMLVTPSGMLISVKAVALRNALAPMLFTLAGMLISVKAVAP